MTSSWTCRNRNVPKRNQKFLHYSSGDRIAVGGAGFGSAPRRYPANCRNFQRRREPSDAALCTLPAKGQCPYHASAPSDWLAERFMRYSARDTPRAPAPSAPSPSFHAGWRRRRIPARAAVRQAAAVVACEARRRWPSNPGKSTGRGRGPWWRGNSDATFAYITPPSVNGLPGRLQQLSQPRQLGWVQRKSLCALERP